tara:strand:- start:62 stop:424 length:363 start_codon:yes stop_codon:yes gene_type:complete
MEITIGLVVRVSAVERLAQSDMDYDATQYKKWVVTHIHPDDAASFFCVPYLEAVEWEHPGLGQDYILAVECEGVPGLFDTTAPLQGIWVEQKEITRVITVCGDKLLVATQKRILLGLIPA